MTMGHLQLQGIRKRFGTVDVIQGIDLDVPDGEFLVFVGPSGCGKSTTLRMIAGLEEISEGELRIDGRRANELAPAERGTAMVFQSYALYPHMTVADNMGFALKMAGASRADRDAAVQRAAETLRITELLGRYPKELSGGQRQRVAIGRAIVRKPAVFLFDEPLSNLDAALRVDMRIELARLHRQLGATMVYVTHDQTEAMTLGDRIAVFNRGRIEQIGLPLEVYERPATEFVATFIGAPRINLIDRPTPGTASEAHVLLWAQLLGTTDLPARRLGVRPEHLYLAPDGVPAQVELAEHLGDQSVLHLRVDGLPATLAVKLSDGAQRLAQGQPVHLAAQPGKALGFDEQGRLLAR
jgi:multiple sugar transport system ATP-binding protein